MIIRKQELTDNEIVDSLAEVAWRYVPGREDMDIDRAEIEFLAMAKQAFRASVSGS